jgi:hypothetical protein
MAPPASLGACSACKFYEATDLAPPTGYGWCRVIAPVRLVGHQPQPTGGLSQQDTRKGQWPLVRAADWCGQWIAAT